MITTQDIKNLGFNSEMLNFSDEILSGQTESPLSVYLGRALLRALHRLQRWVTTEKYNEIKASVEGSTERENYRQALLLLSVVEVLPLYYIQKSAQNGGAEAISVAGFSVKIKGLNVTEQDMQVRQMVDYAYSLVAENINTEGYGFAVL